MDTAGKASQLLGIVLGAALTGLASQAQGSPLAAPIVSHSKQPDGTAINLQQKGNADAVWFETLDGYTVLKNEQQQWVYATEKDTNLEKALSQPSSIVASDLVVGSVDPLEAGLEKHLTGRPKQHDHGSLSGHKAVTGRNPVATLTGVVPLIVILGYYDDALGAPNCTRCATTHPDAFQQLIFSNADSVTSVANYFDEVSQGALTIEPVEESNGTGNDGVVGWLRLGATTPESTAMTTSAYKSNRIAADAILGAMAYVDFTVYDSNDDGNVTSNELGIIVVLGGYEASYGQTESGQTLSDDPDSPRIWGQSRSFVTSSSGVAVPKQTENGRTVSINTARNGMTYSVLGELHGSHSSTMGIITHELGHSVFGLPDLYDINGASYGVGGWSLMGFGSWGKTSLDNFPGETPVLLDAWSRVALGWIEPSTPDNGAVALLYASGQHNGNVIKLPTDNANEYFLIENRQSNGYDRGLAYLIYTEDFGGLAVWHIDDGVGVAGLNNDNAKASHKRVDLIAAVGDEKLDNKTSYGQARNLFYEGNATALSADSDPSTNLYSGSGSGVALSEISHSDVSMTFKAFYTADPQIFSNTSSTGTASAVRSAQDSSAASGGGGGVFNPLVWLTALLAAPRLTQRRSPACPARSTRS